MVNKTLKFWLNLLKQKDFFDKFQQIALATFYVYTLTIYS
ncbi:hypothetical protein FRA_44c12050 [Francisella sp. W12-1067]|nr:hypothetical protein FRA_44c12050 [Francisella sp. W12-1067]